MDERLRLQIWLKAWFWRCVLGLALTWCRWRRWRRDRALILHKRMYDRWIKADQLCLRLARKVEGGENPPQSPPMDKLP